MCALCIPTLMFQRQLLDLVPDRRPNPLLERMKPMQVRSYPKWSKRLLQYLLETGKDFVAVQAAHKADGHSVLFECGDNGRFAIYARTAKRTLLLSGDDAGRFVTRLACDLRTRLACELRALYDGQEMGFLEVLSMLRIFRNNGMQNKGKFELQLCPFGVQSINPDSSLMTERACTFLPPQTMDKLLQELVPPGSALTKPVERARYHARLYEPTKGKYELEYLTPDGRQTVARNPQEFFDFLLAQADAKRIEGFVLSADPAIFAAKPVVVDSYGVRDQSAVKVKREFKVTLLACKVLELKGRQRKEHIFTYALGPDGNTIVFAGEQTGHERLTALLSGAKHAFTFRDKAEKAALYTPSRALMQQHAAQCVMTRSSCTNMSKNRFCPIGLKLHDMSSQPVDLGKLSVLKDVAEANPHFCSTREASNKFAEAIQRGARKAPQYRKRGTLGGSPPPEACKRHKATPAAAPASLSWDDFMDELGEEFKPAPPVAPAIPSEEEEEEEEQPREDTPPAPEPDVKHTVLFHSKLYPMQSALYKRQLAMVGWELALTPGPSVTLIVAANQAAIDRAALPMSVGHQLKEQCPNATFITLQDLKPKLLPVAL